MASISLFVSEYIYKYSKLYIRILKTQTPVALFLLFDDRSNEDFVDKMKPLPDSFPHYIYTVHNDGEKQRTVFYPSERGYELFACDLHEYKNPLLNASSLLKAENKIESRS